MLEIAIVPETKIMSTSKITKTKVQGLIS